MNLDQLPEQSWLHFSNFFCVLSESKRDELVECWDSPYVLHLHRIRSTAPNNHVMTFKFSRVGWMDFDVFLTIHLDTAKNLATWSLRNKTPSSDGEYTEGFQLLARLVGEENGPLHDCGQHFIPIPNKSLEEFHAFLDECDTVLTKLSVCPNGMELLSAWRILYGIGNIQMQTS